jgi:hypothetical protein
MELDTAKWSGEGEFTQILIDALKTIDGLRLTRVENAPATRSDADYHFISNELFVAFKQRTRRERVTRLGFLPGSREVVEPVMALADLERKLAAIPAVGESDYADDGMIQYLRSERVVPPYQTRGYKLVELVRIYAVR